MIQRDYVMRMTELLARALAKILMLKEQSQFEKALDEIDQTGKELLGRDFPVFKDLSGKDLIRWMYSDGLFDSFKCIALSKLLKAEGEICEIQGKLHESRIRYLQALSLLDEAVHQDERNHTDEIYALISWLSEKTLND